MKTTELVHTNIHAILNTAAPSFPTPTLPGPLACHSCLVGSTRGRMSWSVVKVRLCVVCGLVALINFFLFCACGLSLLRVLQAAARDAYSSPRRRLLALDDGVPRRSPSRVMAVLGAFRPFTTQKALLSMLTLSAARECRFLGAAMLFSCLVWPLFALRRAPAWKV